MKFLLVISACIWVTEAIGQTSLAFSHISSEDGAGLNSDQVYTTFQDRKGFIWVGTANGLQRFDGSKFVSFKTGNSSSVLPVSDLTHIVGDDKGLLWLHFSNRREVGVFNPSTFTYHGIPILPAKKLPLRYESRLWRDSRGHLYLTIWKYGLLRYEEKLHAFTDYSGFGLPQGWIPSAFSFEDTVEQRFWFPCPDSGLAMFDVRSGKTYTQQYNSIRHPILNLQEIFPHVSEIFIDSERRYWIFNWDMGHHKRCFSAEGIPLRDTLGLNERAGYQEQRFFHETKNRGFWMYGMNCLYHYEKNNRRFRFIKGDGEQADGIRYSSVNQVMEDFHGGIWISTDFGLYFLSEAGGSQDVINIKLAEKNSNYDITDILELKSGEYWLSTWGEGILTLTNQLQRAENDLYAQMPAFDKLTTARYRQTWALYQQADGKVWIGCQSGQYMIYDPISRHTEFNKTDLAEQATIRYITGDKKGNIWLGTQKGHLIKFDGTQFKLARMFGVVVKRILADQEGLIWVALEGGGLYCLDSTGDQVIRHYQADSGTERLFQNVVHDIDELNDSTIVCAAGAMNFINKRNGSVRWLTVNEGLPGNSVKRIRKDHLGYLWMITSNGLCRYNPVNNRVTPYGRKDGVVLARMTNEADYRCTNHALMFAGGSGLLVFKPEVFNIKQPPPDITITDFKLFDTYLALDSLQFRPFIQLMNDQNSFTIHFSTLSFIQRDKLMYYYRMKGISDEWIRADRLDMVSFSLMPPGRYEFQVYAENIDGHRSINTATMKIHISPPFWRTGWFLSVLLTLIALVAYTMHRLRINRLLAVEKIRNRVARDLHDDMGSTLSTINILSTMAQSKMQTDVNKTSEYINKISENSQRMMEAMDDIVWAIKPSNDSMQKVICRMREFATNVFEAKDIDLDFRTDEGAQEAQLDMEARRDFFLIFKEAANNAAKYSACSHASVSIFTEHRKLMLEVRDNGSGFDVAAADGGNGLGNMKKRADALKGKITINSHPGAGTTVKLAVPLNS